MYPSVGVSYAVPSVSKTGWELMSLVERDADTGEYSGMSGVNLAHYNLYPMVIEYFQVHFDIDISSVGRKCLPRVRIESPESLIEGKREGHGWLVLHGNDMPSILNHQILDEFGLRNVSPDFKYVAYETMDSTDKSQLIRLVPFIKELF